MKSSKLTKAKPTQAQAHWNSDPLEQALLSTPIGLMEQMSASLLAVVLSGINRLSHWFIGQKIKLEKVNMLDRCPRIDSIALPIRVGANARTNPYGIDIIKRFEGFPPDVEPDVREAEQTVKRLVNVPLTSNQFSALVSFTYNLGETTFQQSDLLRHLNAGRYRAAAKEFDRWVYIGSSRFAKLVARRVAERGLFLRDDRVNHCGQ